VIEPMPVPDTLDGERIDSAVALITGWSRADVQVLLASDAIVVDGRPVGKSHRLVAGTVIEILAEPAITALPTGDPTVVVDVRYADEDVVVLAKPVGLVVHSGAGHPDGTLVNGLLALYPEMASVGDEHRPGIVHRLDRDTSGLLVAARTERAYESLVTQISGRTVERRYVALAWGVMSSPRGVIDAPIGRSTSRRTRMAVRESGKPARTEYEVRVAFHKPVCTLLDCRLETGRTHQIRVHLSAIGHPLVGDATYGGARDAIALDRPFLHAAVLGFDQPTTGERLRFEDPLPPDLAGVLEQLEAEH
jgi:23S rRNA pseudouridine1911/1915/1917 synthase